jgi:hypothetical protein
MTDTATDLLLESAASDSTLTGIYHYIMKKGWELIELYSNNTDSYLCYKVVTREEKRRLKDHKYIKRINSMIFLKSEKKDES